MLHPWRPGRLLPSTRLLITQSLVRQLFCLGNGQVSYPPPNPPKKEHCPFSWCSTGTSPQCPSGHQHTSPAALRSSARPMCLQNLWYPCASTDLLPAVKPSTTPSGIQELWHSWASLGIPLGKPGSNLGWWLQRWVRRRQIKSWGTGWVRGTQSRDAPVAREGLLCSSPCEC